MNNQNKGYTVLLIMVGTSLILILFSFWMFSRRGVINLEQQQSTDEQVTSAMLEWGGFSNAGRGISFQYPKNLFVSPQVNETPAGSMTRVFLGTANRGTFSAAVIDRQFDSRNIIDPASGKIGNASAINAAGTTGYQYEVVEDNCRSKIVQIPHSFRIAMFSFSSCSFDEEPRLAEDNELMLQILGSIKLTAVIAPPEPDPATTIDTLPPM